MMRITTALAALATTATLGFAPAVLVAAPASADTPTCVDRAEFKKVERGMKMSRVHAVFDVSGKQTSYDSGYPTKIENRHLPQREAAQATPRHGHQLQTPPPKRHAQGAGAHTQRSRIDRCLRHFAPLTPTVELVSRPRAGNRLPTYAVTHVLETGLASDAGKHLPTRRHFARLSCG